MAAPSMVSSVSLPDGTAMSILAEALDDDIALSDYPPYFADGMAATAGIQFIFDKHDEYLPEVNDWQLTRATKTRSRHTRATRSSALKAILGWYEANDLSWQNCNELAHLNLIRLHFRGDDDGKRKPLVAKSTWNQWMVHWYQFLMHAEPKGWVDDVGFDLRDAQEMGRSTPNVRALTPEEFLKFDAAIDSQRLRAGVRSIIGTGLRVSELASLTTSAVPLPQEHNGQAYRARPVIGKGQKERVIYWPLAATKSLYAYRLGERALAVDALKERVNAGKVPIETTYLAWDIDAASKARALIEKPDAPLWLAENGDALSGKRWGKEFAQVSDVCGLHVSPHWLRHTYAVVTLSMLIKQQIRQEIIEAKLGTARQKDYFLSPLEEVQTRLGHASIETTMIYLAHIAEHRHLVSLAIADLEQMYFND